jgi:hypothetical protein
MKKFLIGLGVIFLLLILVVAVLIGYAAFTGSKLDKESKAYVDAAVPAILSSWNEQELLSRESPEFQKATSSADVDRLFRWFRTLGPLHKYEGARGEAITSVTPQTGKVISARYVAKAVFNAGEANVEVGLIKHGSQWQIARFNVIPPAPIPQ